MAEREACRNGHPWIEANIRLDKDGYPKCRPCGTEATRRSREKKKRLAEMSAAEREVEEAEAFQREIDSWRGLVGPADPEKMPTIGPVIAELEQILFQLLHSTRTRPLGEYEARRLATVAEALRQVGVEQQGTNGQAQRLLQGKADVGYSYQPSD